MDGHAERGVAAYPDNSPTRAGGRARTAMSGSQPYGKIGDQPQGRSRHSIPTATASPPGSPSERIAILVTEVGANKSTDYATGRSRVRPGRNTHEPLEITAAGDGTLWFTQSGVHKIGRITPAGDVIEYPLPSGSEAEGVAAGPDGNVWFADQANREIGRITPQGQVTEYPLPAGAGDTAPDGIAAGADGDLWFTQDNDNIGRITPAGQVSEFPVPSADSGPSGIAAGPDGNVWFAEQDGDRIGQIITGAGAAVVSAPSVTGPARQGMPVSCQGEQWASGRAARRARSELATPRGSVAARRLADRRRERRELHAGRRRRGSPACLHGHGDVPACWT